jgi:hypothetical protein
MLIETYEEPEIKEESFEQTEEALALIDALELEGQKPSEEKAEKRMPYREMKAEELFVFQVLCPVSTSLKKYSRTSLPLRVLQVAAYAKELGVFEELFVWDAADASQPDHVLVGSLKGAPSWHPKICALARWGESLESWPIMLKQALDIKRNQILQAIEKAKKELEKAYYTDNDLISKGAHFNPCVSI